MSTSDDARVNTREAAPRSAHSLALRAALTRISSQASQLKDIESKLAENLSNFRAIDSMLQEAFAGLHRNSRRADRALDQHVPRIYGQLDDSTEALSELAETLPTIQSQVADIRRVYDSGQYKAQQLEAELKWLDTEFYERWRSIIFTSSSPVSWRWKALMRLLFALTFISCAWVAWIALRGAYRAHKQRLVWGERLMS